MLPCRGDSAPGIIIWIATQEMILAGKAELCVSFLQIREILEARCGEASLLIIAKFKPVNKTPPLFSGYCCGR